MARPHVVVVGSGGAPYREYSFQSLAADYTVSGVFPSEATWQTRYLRDHRVADCTDPTAIAAAVTSLVSAGEEYGIFTWDELVLEPTARAAELLGVPHMSVAAVDNCRDKYRTRSRMADAGLPSPKFRLTTTAADAVAAADEFGYPVVVKPRSLAGSAGVTLATDADAVRTAFDLVGVAQYGTLLPGAGVLVEEFLDGPEISVDSVVFDGVMELAYVAAKRLGFPPYFEEVGHVVGALGIPPGVYELVEAAHRVVGVNQGVTHAELKLTADGPRLVELNGRLGGDLIPFISRLATGIDLVPAAADLALGRRPSVVRTARSVAEVRFVYPPHDCVVRSVQVDAAASVAGIAHAAVLAEPGTRLLLPPRNAIPRLAALVAVGADADATARSLDAAERAVVADLEPVTPGSRFGHATPDDPGHRTAA